MFPKFPATETASHILCPTHDAIVDASIVTWDEGAQRRNSEKFKIADERKRERERECQRESDTERKREI